MFLAKSTKKRRSFTRSGNCRNWSNISSHIGAITERNNSEKQLTLIDALAKKGNYEESLITYFHIPIWLHVTIHKKIIHGTRASILLLFVDNYRINHLYKSKCRFVIFSFFLIHIRLLLSTLQLLQWSTALSYLNDTHFFGSNSSLTQVKEVRTPNYKWNKSKFVFGSSFVILFHRLKRYCL